MTALNKLKIFTLFQREILEHRNPLLITPALIGGVLVLFALLSVLLANRVSFIGDSAMEILIDEHSSGINITIETDEQIPVEDLLIQQDPVAPDANVDGDWDFGSDWTFEPEQRDKLAKKLDQEIESLNPVLNALHLLFLLILMLVSSHYLLSCLHQDRRDRSVLFWKSMPVSEWEEIGAKMVTVCVLAPGIYVAISFLTQIAYILLAMLLVWRMDMSAGEVVLSNVNFLSLLGGQLSAWLLWSLWTMPVFAWLLLCSAAAKRSPMLLAVAVPLALVIVEELFLGDDSFSQALGNHIAFPQQDEGAAITLQSIGPNWTEMDYMGLMSGLGISAILLYATHWFRKNRFER